MRVIFLSLAVLAIFAWRPLRADTVLVINPNVSAYSEPSTKSEILLELPKNRIVERTQQKGGWAQVRIQVQGFDFHAWVPASSLKRITSAKGPTRRKVVRGEIVYVTHSEAYLNVGRQNGLSNGLEVQVLPVRGARTSCRIQSVSDHSAICVGEALHVGDSIRATGEEDISTPNEDRVVVRLTQIELSRRQNLVTLARFEKIAYVPKNILSNQLRSLPVKALVRHDSWVSSGSTSYHREQVSLSALDVAISKDWSASADLSTWFWTGRSKQALFRPDDDLQFYLHEASVTYDSPSNPYHLTAGRLRPHDLPGLVLLDGIQAGFKVSKWQAEFGVYGGMLPDLSSLYPEKRPILAGLYYQQDLVMTRNWLVREELRVGLTNYGSSGNRIELETFWSTAWRRLVDLSTEARIGLAGENMNGPELDALRIDLGVRPVSKLYVNAGGRLLENQSAEFSQTIMQGARHGDINASYEIYSWLTVGISGGVAQEKSGDSLDRFFAGPEARFIGLLGSKSRMNLSYLEEFGWFRGRSFYFSPMKEFARYLRWVGRGSFSQEALAEQQTYEWGMYSGIETTLFDRIFSRIFVNVRDGTGPLGVTGGLEFSGQI